MAAWYTKLSMCVSAAASSRKQQELIAAAAVVQTLGKKRKWRSIDGNIRFYSIVPQSFYKTRNNLF